jgi:hypothetical protein
MSKMIPETMGEAADQGGADVIRDRTGSRLTQFHKDRVSQHTLVNDNVRQVEFDCDPPSILSCSRAATVTPLPSTLPLFATSIDVLSLLGWRRKGRIGLLLIGTPGHCPGPAYYIQMPFRIERFSTIMLYL